MPDNRIGLIDYGQCKVLSDESRTAVAKLIVAVSDRGSTSKEVADAFRGAGMRSKNDSDEFLARLAGLMFGPIIPEYLDYAWHKELHKLDKTDGGMPPDLMMVYRAAMLLRGLGLALQQNMSVSGEWAPHAKLWLAQQQQQLDAGADAGAGVR